MKDLLGKGPDIIAYGCTRDGVARNFKGITGPHKLESDPPDYFLEITPIIIKFLDFI